MTVRKYNKLVRGRIPEIVEASGSAAGDLFVDLFAEDFGAEKDGWEAKSDENRI